MKVYINIFKAPPLTSLRREDLYLKYDLDIQQNTNIADENGSKTENT